MSQTKIGGNMKPKFGEIWIADISFFKGNFKSRYIIQIEKVEKNFLLFKTAFTEYVGKWNSSKVESFELIRKVDLYESV